MNTSPNHDDKLGQSNPSFQPIQPKPHLKPLHMAPSMDLDHPLHVSDEKKTLGAIFESCSENSAHKMSGSSALNHGNMDEIGMQQSAGHVDKTIQRHDPQSKMEVSTQISIPNVRPSTGINDAIKSESLNQTEYPINPRPFTTLSTSQTNNQPKRDNPLSLSGAFYSTPQLKRNNSIPFPTASRGFITNLSVSDPTNIQEVDHKRSTQLMEHYSPYIHPDDESLEAARSRIIKAIDQTRQLRAAFTERVYHKYRILLRSVPKDVNEIFDTILEDPDSCKMKLEHEIDNIKEEKEIEKREALQKAASIAAANATEGETVDVNVTNSDDHYYGAGLNIVILPEEDLDEDDPILREYEHRGPTDPDTGQRLGGISSAAAAAAETVLERARRGLALRTERLRMAATLDKDDKKIIYEKQKQRISTSDLLSLQSHSMALDRQSKQPIKNQGVASTASTSSLLVVSPRAEISGSASAAALAMAGVGTSTKSKRHPFPNSKAGLDLSKAGGPIVNEEFLLPSNIEHKKNMTDYEDVTEEYAPKQALKSVVNVLKYFQVEEPVIDDKLTNDEPTKPVSESKDESNVSILETDDKPALDEKIKEQTPPKNIIPTKRKRKVNEIGLLRSLRFNEITDKQSIQNTQNEPKCNEKNVKLAYSILFSLGIFGGRTTDFQRHFNACSTTSNDILTSVKLMKDETLVLTNDSVSKVIFKHCKPMEKKPTLKIELSNKSDTGKRPREEEPETKVSKMAKPNEPEVVSEHEEKKIMSPVSQETKVERKKQSYANPSKQKMQQIKNLEKQKDQASDVIKASAPQASSDDGSKPPFPTNLPPMVPQQNQQSPAGAWNPLLGRYPQTPNQSLLQNQGQLYQSLGIDQGFGVLPQTNSPYTSALNGGLNNTQQHLNHQILNNTDRFNNSMLSPNNNRMIYPDVSLSPNPQDYYNNNTINRPANSPPFIDWPSLTPSLLNQASSMIGGGLNLTPAQARNMIMHLREQSRAMIAREQNVVATAQAIAARNNLNNLSKLPSFSSSGILQNNQPDLNQRRLSIPGIRLQNSPQQGNNIDLSSTLNVAPASSPMNSLLAGSNQQPLAATNSNTMGSFSNQSQTINTTPNVTMTPSLPTQQPVITQPTDIHEEKTKKSVEVPKSADTTFPSLTGKDTSLPAIANSNSLDKSSRIEPKSKENDSSGSKVEPSKALTQSLPKTPTSQLICPEIPSGLTLESATLVLQGHIHKVQENKPLALEYLLAIAKAIPMDKTPVQSAFKERTECLQNSRVSLYASKDVVISAISGCLWAEHGDCFQLALKNGRIDDPECKWLIHTAVDVAIISLQMELDNGSSEEEISDYDIASIICDGLMSDICIDDDMDISSTNFQELIKLLDNRREMALRQLSRERALLANLISRHVNISEFFSNAYISSMVRAGEAIGHEELCELVHDDECFSSSLLPYDVIVDETGAWEEPCQPEKGYTVKLTADELSKRAHARSRIHKSLYKLQEKFGMRGGVVNAGPYADTGGNESSTFTSFPSLSGSRSSSAGLKRRTSSGSIQSMDYGSSSGMTAGMAQVFNPSHSSIPLLWDLDDIHNKPYGIYGAQGKRGRKHKKARLHSTPNKGDGDEEQKITGAIDWMHVAERFHSVTAAEPSQSKEKIGTGPIIFAPVVRVINDANLKSVESDSGSDLEEDISDEAVLARHQEVLDAMKHKLEMALETTPRRR